MVVDSGCSTHAVLGVLLMNVVKSVAILALIGICAFDPAREMLIALLTPRTHIAAPVVRASAPKKKWLECPNSTLRDADGDPRCMTHMEFCAMNDFPYWCTGNEAVDDATHDREFNVRR